MPFIVIEPDVGRPERSIERRDVLPAPDGPINAVRLPAAKEAFTSLRTRRVTCDRTDERTCTS
eukprot:908378-Prymnesium_polylepis.3